SRKRRRAAVEVSASSLRSLSATSRPSALSRARYTVLNAPRPISPAISKPCSSGASSAAAGGAADCGSVPGLAAPFGLNRMRSTSWSAASSRARKRLLSLMARQSIASPSATRAARSSSSSPSCGAMESVVTGELLRQLLHGAADRHAGDGGAREAALACDPLVVEAELETQEQRLAMVGAQLPERALERRHLLVLRQFRERRLVVRRRLR